MSKGKESVVTKCIQLRESLDQKLQRVTKENGLSQRDIVEKALAAYFRKYQFKKPTV